jgi:hypothetical protein
LGRSSTFDLHVMDTATRWANYQHEQATTGKKPVPKMSEEAMIEMIKRVKEKKP